MRIRGVISAAGLGGRSLPATRAVPKEMLTIVATPAIRSVVQEAVRRGVHDILVVTGPGTTDIEDHVVAGRAQAAPPAA